MLPDILHIKRLSLGLLCIFLLCLVSCGRKDFPVPPGTLRPKPIKDLRLKVTEKGMKLTWSLPVRNMDGSPLPWIKGFQLYRAGIPVEDSCDTCPPEFGSPVWIPYKAEPEEGKKMIYEDRTVQPGYRYTYEVKTVKGWLNVSDPSNRVTGAWHMPPGAPQGLSYTLGPQGIGLSWKAPSTWADGKSLEQGLFYRVYRARYGTGGWKAVSDLLRATEFYDLTAKRGRDYEYRVAAVLPYYDTEIEGASTPAIRVSFKDMVPPSRPQGLVAVAGHEGVELLWQENPDIDLSGYYVYRRDPDSLVGRLNHTPLSVPRFVDRTRLAPGRYRYWVTAVDRADPPNESPPSREVEVVIPE